MDPIGVDGLHDIQVVVYDKGGTQRSAYLGRFSGNQEFVPDGSGLLPELNRVGAALDCHSGEGCMGKSLLKVEISENVKAAYFHEAIKSGFW